MSTAAPSDEALSPSPSPPPAARTAVCDAEKQRGNAAFASGDYATAVEAYTAAINSVAAAGDWRQQQSPSSSSPRVLFCNRAAAQLKLRNWAGAAADASEALAIAPADLKALRRRAAARTELGDVFGAVDDLRLALMLVPGDAETAKELREMRQKLPPEETDPVGAAEEKTPLPTPPPGAEVFRNPLYLADPVDREMVSMELLKGVANNNFKRGYLSYSEFLYSNCLSRMSVEFIVSGETKELRVAVLCNRAAARLKLGNFKGAREDCSIVLEVRCAAQPRAAAAESGIGHSSADGKSVAPPSASKRLARTRLPVRTAMLPDFALLPGASSCFLCAQQQMDPGNYKALRRRAEACERLGFTSLAFDDLADACELFPSDEELSSALMRVAKASGRWGGSVEHITAIVSTERAAAAAGKPPPPPPAAASCHEPPVLYVSKDMLTSGAGGIAQLSELLALSSGGDPLMAGDETVRNTVPAVAVQQQGGGGGREGGVVPGGGPTRSRRRVVAGAAAAVSAAAVPAVRRGKRRRHRCRRRRRRRRGEPKALQRLQEGANAPPPPPRQAAEEEPRAAAASSRSRRQPGGSARQN